MGFFDTCVIFYLSVKYNVKLSEISRRDYGYETY